MHAVLQLSLRTAVLARSDVETAGPFLLAFDPDSHSPFRNYAVPADDARPTPGDVAALCAAFDRRGLAPRLEFLPDAAPHVQPALQAAGFAIDDRLAIMACRRGQLRRPSTPPGVEVELARGDEALRRAATAQGIAYGQPAIDEADVARLRRTVTGGGFVAVAHEIGGSAIGAALIAPPVDDIAELSAVGVVPTWRRRGVAGAITGLLARAAFHAGIVTVILMAYEIETGVYARAGFTRVSEIVFASRQSSSGATTR